MALRGGRLAYGFLLLLLLFSLGAGAYRLAGMFGLLDRAAYAGLPVVPVPGPAPTRGDAPAVLLLSADGGWARTDQVVAAALAGAGMPVVGWNSLRYFVTPRTPESTARDVAAVVEHYAAAWGRKRVVLVGYSFGADVLPFVVNRLPPGVRGRVAGLVLLSFGADADFVFHLRDWMSSGVVGSNRPTVPELRRILDVPILCIEGTGDPSGACHRAGTPNVEVHDLRAGHSLGRQAEGVGRMILQWMDRTGIGRRGG